MAGGAIMGGRSLPAGAEGGGGAEAHYVSQAVVLETVREHSGDHTVM